MAEELQPTELNQNIPTEQKSERLMVSSDIDATKVLSLESLSREEPQEKIKAWDKTFKGIAQSQAQVDNKKPIISVKNISKSFTSGAGKTDVLNDISFDIMPASFNIIFGPSGSGKTTILNTILGLEKPDSGVVSFSEKDIYRFNQDQMAQFRAHRYGVIYQSSNWVESLNVVENVALPLLFLGIEESWSYSKAKENLELVGMSDFAKRNPRTLSGGQQQRISLARSLVNNPWVIIADEPTGNLDSKAGEDVMKILYDLTKNLKRTIVLVTHNLDYVILATQMVYIKDGRLSTREEALPKPIKLDFKV